MEYKEILVNLGEQCNEILIADKESLTLRVLYPSLKNRITVLDISSHELQHDGVKYCNKSTLEVDIEEDLGENMFDMLILNTFHVYGQLRRELVKFHGIIRKYIIIMYTEIDGIHGELERTKENGHLISNETRIPYHELIKGTKEAISELLASHPHWSLKVEYKEHNGMIVLKREESSTPSPMSKNRLILITTKEKDCFGHELHWTRSIILDKLARGVISPEDTIMTDVDRTFLYSSIFKCVIDRTLYKTIDKSQYKRIIDLTHYDGRDRNNYYTPKFVSLMPRMDLNENIKINHDFVLIHHRYDAPIDKLQQIYNTIKNNLKMMEIIVFYSSNCPPPLPITHCISNLRTYVSLMKLPTCKLIISEWSGAGQIAQYCFKGCIMYYPGHYNYQDMYLYMRSPLERMYKIMQKYNRIPSYYDNIDILDMKARELICVDGDIFEYVDYKVGNGCKRYYYTNFDSMISAINIDMIVDIIPEYDMPPEIVINHCIGKPITLLEIGDGSFTFFMFQHICVNPGCSAVVLTQNKNETNFILRHDLDRVFIYEDGRLHRDRSFDIIYLSRHIDDSILRPLLKPNGLILSNFKEPRELL